MEKLPKEERKRMKDLARFARDPYVREYFGTYSRLSIVLPRIFWELGGEEWRKKGKEILMRRFNPRQYFEELHHGRPASEFLIMLLRRKDIDAALKKYPELIKIPPLLPTHPKFDELRDKGIVKDVVFNPFTEYYLKLINLVLRRRYPLYYDPWVDDVWARRLTREKGYRQLGRTVDPIERMKNTYQKFHDALDHFLRTGILKYEDLYEIYKTHKELEYDMNEFVLWRVVGKNLKEGGIRSAWKKNIDQLAEDIKKAEEEYTVFQEAHEMLGAGISILF